MSYRYEGERRSVVKKKKGRVSTKGKISKAWGWIRRNMARTLPKPNPPADQPAE